MGIDGYVERHLMNNDHARAPTSRLSIGDLDLGALVGSYFDFTKFIRGFHFSQVSRTNHKNLEIIDFATNF